MIIALIGGTCVGKTSVMRKLAELLKCPSRSCGGRVMEVATEQGKSPEQLSSDSHRAIDSETLEYCASAQKISLVDGRFLHFVLSGQANDIRIIELSASEAERAARAAKRSRGPSDSNENAIQNSDQSDRLFCEQMYAGRIALESEVSIDTTNLEIDEVACAIIDRLNLKLTLS